MGPDQLAHLVQTFSYPAVLLLLLACGVGVPLSEDLILLTGGLVVAKGHGSLPLMIATGYLGVVMSDFLIFRIGRKLGPKVTEAKRFRKIFTPKRLEWLQDHFHRHGSKTVFLARLVPGMRLATFLSAGVSHMTPLRFVAIDAAASLITAPLLVFLGHRFGISVFHDVEQVGRWLAFAFAILLATYVVIRIARAKRRTAQPETTARALHDIETVET